MEVTIFLLFFFNRKINGNEEIRYSGYFERADGGGGTSPQTVSVTTHNANYEGVQMCSMFHQFHRVNSSVNLLKLYS